MKKLTLAVTAIVIGVAILYAIFCVSLKYPARISYSPFSIFNNYPTITVMIGGDVMLDRHIRAIGQSKGYDSLFEDVRTLFQQADIAVINLEGPITSNISKTLLPNGRTTGDMNFTFNPIVAKSIAAAGIDAVSLANNHTDNFFRTGIDETKKWLVEAGVDWFGDPANISNTEQMECVRHGQIVKNELTSIVKNPDNFCVAFVGYHEFHSGIDNVLADIRRLSSRGYAVIVMPHWGDEYATTSPPRLRQKAIKFIEAGAIAIVGSHPHVVEETERINNVPVIYSLGNLIFDQYFSDDVMKGQIAEIVLEKQKSGVKIKKIILHTISNHSRNGPELVGEPIEF